MAVGCWHPDFLRHVLSAEQWQGWIRFNEVEPLGEWRHDARTLALWQAIRMSAGGEKPDEIFLPTLPYRRTPVDGEAVYAKVLAMREAEGAQSRSNPRVGE